MVHGDNDERVPLDETLQMYNKLHSKGHNVKLLRFADEGHGVTKLSSKIMVCNEIMEWLKPILDS